MRTDWIKREEMQHLLAALTPQNRLALEISLSTGLRISDVLGIKTEDIRACSDGRITVRELKTGKKRRVRLPAELCERALRFGGRLFVFEHRHDWRKHRTRQAVFKDLKRAAKLFRVKSNVAPHTARKAWAVAEYHKDGSMKRVQALMNHESEAVTMLYAMADEMTERRLKNGKRDTKASASKTCNA